MHFLSTFPQEHLPAWFLWIYSNKLKLICTSRNPEVVGGLHHQVSSFEINQSWAQEGKGNFQGTSKCHHLWICPIISPNTFFIFCHKMFWVPTTIIALEWNAAFICAYTCIVLLAYGEAPKQPCPVMNKRSLSIILDLSYWALCDYCLLLFLFRYSCFLWLAWFVQTEKVIFPYLQIACFTFYHLVYCRYDWKYPERYVYQKLRSPTLKVLN